eukprot:3292263-Amphidinium_carterae.1
MIATGFSSFKSIGLKSHHPRDEYHLALTNGDVSRAGVPLLCEHCVHAKSFVYMCSYMVGGANCSS